MGCVCVINKTSVSASRNVIDGRRIKIPKITKNLFYKILTSNWIKIIDYLKFTDLKEVGRVNR